MINTIEKNQSTIAPLDNTPDDRDLWGAWLRENDIRKCKVHEAVFEVFSGTLHNNLNKLDSDLKPN